MADSYLAVMGPCSQAGMVRLTVEQLGKLGMTTLLSIKVRSCSSLRDRQLPLLSISLIKAESLMSDAQDANK